MVMINNKIENYIYNKEVILVLKGNSKAKTILLLFYFFK